MGSNLGDNLYSMYVFFSMDVESTKSSIYRKDTEHLYHAFMYSIVKTSLDPVTLLLSIYLG